MNRSLTDLKDVIKEIPVSDIIGKYLSLVKRGPQITAVCPFHNDSHPSLSISDTKGLFKCFACQVGGDSITFVQKFKNLDFLEALKEIAQTQGIPYEEFDGPKKRDPRFEMGLKILQSASKIYRKTAQAHSSELYQHFLKTRGIDEKTAHQFQLGFAPHHSVIYPYLESLTENNRESAIKQAFEIGLIRKKQGIFDTFRDRIMFPIWDSSSRIVGFGSRAIHDYQKGKYINSQESYLFNKKDILYGLNFAKSSIREKDQVILVEGYMDAISLHKNGFTNSVSVMGVGLGEKSFKALKAMTKNFLLALDSDDAGMSAMQRMNRDLMQEGVLPQHINFHPHKDPDDFLKMEGPLALAEKIDTAPYLIDFLIEKLMPETMPTLSEKKLSLLNEVFELLAPLKEHLRASERILAAAKRLGLRSDPEQILSAYKNYLNDNAKNRKVVNNPSSKAEIPIKLETVQASQPTEKRTKELSTVEKMFLREVIHHPECLNSPYLPEILDFMGHNEVKRIVQWLKNLFYEIEETEYSSIITNYLMNEGYDLNIKEVVGPVLYDYKYLPINEKVANRIMFDVRNKLKISKLAQTRSLLRQKQKTCQDEVQVLHLIEELQKLEEELRHLKIQRISE